GMISPGGCVAIKIKKEVMEMEGKRCRDCNHYKPIDDEKGDCFGAEVLGDRDPAESEKCEGRFFEPKENKEV
ncbi:MAG: hypothetical protein AAB267_05635, partial [Candidatus Desantisbacteria bacterium]